VFIIGKQNILALILSYEITLNIVGGHESRLAAESAVNLKINDISMDT